MDKNTLFGMVLMGLVLFGFMYCNRPKADEQAATTSKTEQTVVATTATANSLTPEFEASMAEVVRNYGVNDGNGNFTLKTPGVNLTTTTADTIVSDRIAGTVVIGRDTVNVAAAFNAADTLVTARQRSEIYDMLANVRSERTRYQDFAKFIDETPSAPFSLSNGKMVVTFNPKGGRMERVVLPGYLNENTDPAKDVELFNPEHSNYAFVINMGDRELSTADMTFRPEVSDDSTRVTMKLDLAPDTWMAFTYTLMPDQYIVRLDVTQHNLTESAIRSNVTEMGFDWSMDLERNEVGRSFEERNSAIYYKLKDDSPDDLSANSAETESIAGAIQWVAFKNQFFSSVVIPRGYFKTAEMSSQPIERDTPLGQRYVKSMSLKSRFEYKPDNDFTFGFDFYLGPNSYPGLSKVDDILYPDGPSLSLQKLVPLGWGIFGWINRFIVIPLFNFLGSFITSYGLIILLLTIIIKIILFPFTYKSYMSQARMRVLAPEIKEINDKYPGQENAMKRQQETMKLYSRAGASPFSGCLPMLLQLPVLIALFSFFPSAIELRGQSFLWAHDLAAPDYICTLPFTIPFYGNKVSLFCLLMTVTNIVYTRISMASNPSAGMAGMKWMTYLMPVMFLFFFNDYASGLSYYYFISLLITIAQTYICRLIVNDDKVRAQMRENAKKPKKKSGFMARLEAAQKRQEAMMREQAKQRAKRGR